MKCAVLVGCAWISGLLLLVPHAAWGLFHYILESKGQGDQASDDLLGSILTLYIICLVVVPCLTLLTVMCCNKEKEKVIELPKLPPIASEAAASSVDDSQSWLMTPSSTERVPTEPIVPVPGPEEDPEQPVPTPNPPIIELPSGTETEEEPEPIELPAILPIYGEIEVEKSVS